MPRYSLDTTLPSCSVPLPLLLDLERYLSRKCHEIVPEGVHKQTVTIEESLGKEELRSIEEYYFHVFPNDTKEIQLSQNAEGDGSSVSAILSFNATGYLSNLRIACDATAGRELAQGIRSGVLELLKPYSNHNHVYHSVLIPLVQSGWFLCLMIFVILFSSETITHTYIKTMARSVFFVVSLVSVSFFVLRSMCPYTVFHTRLNEQRAKIRMFIISGVGASLVASLLYGILTR